MRIMGLDVGSKTVGVAVSDPLGFTAQGLEIIQIDEDKKEFGLERLAELVAQYKVDRFVVGLPKNMKQHQRTACGRPVRLTARMIAEKFELPVELPRMNG